MAWCCQATSHYLNQCQPSLVSWCHMMSLGYSELKQFSNLGNEQMESFSTSLAFVRGIHRSPVNSPHKGQWRGAVMFSLICAWMNGWVSNREAVDLRRHRVHYDFTHMQEEQVTVFHKEGLHLNVPSCCWVMIEHPQLSFCFPVKFSMKRVAAKCTLIQHVSLVFQVRNEMQAVPWRFDLLCWFFFVTQTQHDMFLGN